MRTRIIAFATLLCASCTQPYADRLAPRDLPPLVRPEPGTPRQPAAVTPAAGTAPAEPEEIAFAAVPPATFTEGAVFRFIETILEKKGNLAALPKGKTLVDRLRYCVSRLQLDQAPRVLPELERLSRDHADHAVVWRVLGLAYEATAARTKAIAAYRRCYALDAKSGFQNAPSVITALGDALLLVPERREEGMKFLREQIATGPRYVEAAGKLSAIYKGLEDYVQCLAVLEAGLARDGDALQLRFYKGLALLELHQLQRGIEILRPLADHPIYGEQASWFLARGLFLDAQFDPALVIVDRLRKTAGIPVQRHRQYDRLRERIVQAQEGKATKLNLWDYGAILRGNESVKTRLEVLRMLAGQKPRIAGFALKVAFNSDSPLLRAEALQLLVRRAAEPVQDLVAGFGDADGRVRAKAAELAVGLGEKLPEQRQALASIVLGALAVEADPYAFRVTHDSLQSLTGTKIEIPFGGAKDPVQRAAIVQAWKERQ